MAIVLAKNKSEQMDITSIIISSSTYDETEHIHTGDTREALMGVYSDNRTGLYLWRSSPIFEIVEQFDKAASGRRRLLLYTLGSYASLLNVG